MVLLPSVFRILDETIFNSHKSYGSSSAVDPECAYGLQVHESHEVCLQVIVKLLQCFSLMSGVGNGSDAEQSVQETGRLCFAVKITSRDLIVRTGCRVLTIKSSVVEWTWIA